MPSFSEARAIGVASESIPIQTIGAAPSPTIHGNPCGLLSGQDPACRRTGTPPRARAVPRDYISPPSPPDPPYRGG